VISQGERRPRRRRTGLWLALGLAGAALFAVGVAVGEALHDNPRPGGTRTYVRTLHPLRVAPSVPARTITVTATS
jgi:hypothetical protein